MKRTLIQLSLGLAISAALVVLLLRIVDLGAVLSAVVVADPRPIMVAVGVYLLAMWIRSLLWRRLLPAADSTRTLFRVSIVGFAVNYLMPLRVGEIARAFLLKNWCGLPYGTTLASMVAERVLDGLAVGGILLVALLFVPAPGYVLVLGLGVAAIFGGLATLLLLASWRVGFVLSVSRRIARQVPVRMRTRVERLGRGFIAGLEPLRDRRALPGLAALAVLGWLCQFAVFYILMLAFPIPASFPMALVGGGVANFATLLPSAPGYVGTFDAALIKLLVDLQGVKLESAAAYALVVHTVLVVPIVLLAAVVLWRANLSFGQVMGIGLPARRAATAPGTASAAASAAVSTSVLPSIGV
jgi:uncharacterized protein (TIRG00374 family)